MNTSTLTVDDTSTQGKGMLRTLILYAPLLSVTVLGKFAFPVGSGELLVAVPIIFAVTALGFVTGVLKLHTRRTMLYLIFISSFAAMETFAVASFNFASLMLLFVTYWPFIFELRHPLEDPRRHMRRFLNFVMFIALAGVAQYSLQFVIGAKYAFPIEHLLPGSIVTHAYNTLNNLSYGSTVFKANGLFLPEAANFSQLLALAFTVECVMFRRIPHLFSYLAGMTVAFSGTGIMILMFTIPTLIIIYRRMDVLLLMLAAGVLAVCLADVLGLDLFVKRASELERPGSSGFARFTGGLYFFDQFLAPNPQTWLFGMGSGTLHEAGFGGAHQIFPLPAYPVCSSSAWIKIVSEFGLVGCFTFFWFLFASVIRAQNLLLLRVGMCVVPMLIGVMDSWIPGLMLTLLLWSPAPLEKLQPITASDRKGVDAKSTAFGAGLGHTGGAGMPAAS